MGISWEISCKERKEGQKAYEAFEALEGIYCNFVPAH